MMNTASLVFHKFTQWSAPIFLSTACWIPVFALAQQNDNINFQDLARPGQPVVKQYSVTGVADDGRRYLLKFDGVDTARAEAMRAPMAAAPSTYSGSSTSETRNTRQQQPGNFVCHFVCSTVKILTPNDKLPEQKISVSASSESDASDKGLPIAKSFCWDNFKMIPHQALGFRAVRCSKR